MYGEQKAWFQGAKKHLLMPTIYVMTQIKQAEFKGNVRWRNLGYQSEVIHLAHLKQW